MKKIFLIFLFLFLFKAKAQVKLCIDSTLFQAYQNKYGFSEGFMPVPFFCDPFCKISYKKEDTAGLCGKYVFIDRNKFVRIKGNFDLPCWFEPRFSSGLCAVSIDQQIVFIDTNGAIKIRTGLSACSKAKNYVRPFRNGRARVYKGSGTLKNFYDVYDIDVHGKRIPNTFAIKVKPKPKLPVIAAKEPEPDKNRADDSRSSSSTGAKQTEQSSSQQASDVSVIPPVFDLPVKMVRGIYHLPESEKAMWLSRTPHKDNRMLLFYECGTFQLENMSAEDTVFCNKFVFTDSLFNVRISGGFKLPCNFEPEFSEGLCAVSSNNEIVYIDTMGNVVIRTGLKACDTILNKASTFRNGIATLYIGDSKIRGLYTTIAINVRGERVRLLEYDDLDLAVNKIGKFSNMTAEESVNCFVGRAKTNGYWFLIEKNGKVRKKLEPVSR